MRSKITAATCCTGGAVFCVAVFIVLFCLSTGAFGATFEERFEQTLSAEGVQRVVLGNTNGTVRVEGWERDEISVEATKKVRAGDRDKAEEGAEVIVGAFRDSQFGPTVMFGLGGVFVEVLDDVSFRVAPVSEADAEEMIREIRGYRILRGYRGRPPADLEAVKEIILKVSKMVTELREIGEVDLNPIYVYEEGAVAVDVKIILEKS